MLFDSGATHSFISYDLANRIDRHAEILDCGLSVSTPKGEVMFTDQV